MDADRLRRAPAGLARRWRQLRRDYATRSLHTGLRFDAAAAPVLLSPHWDDAVFDCWALLSDPSELLIVNLFAGIPPAGQLTRWDRVTGAAESAVRARERITEDVEALARAERTAINVALLDAEYREPGPPPSLATIDRALQAVVSTTSRVYAPAALGQNEDHRLTRWYARTLSHQGIPVSLYADLPYCVTHGWPHWVDGSEPDRYRDVDAFWRTLLVDVPELEDLRAGRVSRLDDAQAASKLAAMRTYRTQFPSLDGGRTGLLSNPDTHRFEVLWELQAPEGNDRARPARRRRRV